MRKIYENTKQDKRARLHKKVRSKVSGTTERPRLAVYKSNRFIYAQLINDENNQSLAQASDMKTYLASKDNKIASAKKVGQAIAEEAKKLKVNKVVFDRGGFPFRGRVKALAEAAREAGLEF